MCVSITLVPKFDSCFSTRGCIKTAGNERSLCVHKMTLVRFLLLYIYTLLFPFYKFKTVFGPRYLLFTYGTVSVPHIKHSRIKMTFPKLIIILQVIMCS